MLYLDASALVKRYFREAGSEAVNARFAVGERIFTSVLSYAEVQAALGRKCHQGRLSRADFKRARDSFLQDFVFNLSILEVDTNTVAAVPALVERYPIRGADAIHLSAALWLRDRVRLVAEFAAGEKTVEFGTADKQLEGFARDWSEQIARNSGLVVLHF